MPQFIVLDESKQSRHGILAFGGVVVDTDELPTVETEWRSARKSAGIKTGEALKYSMHWTGGREQRAELITAIGDLPIQAVIALLEDFRPLRMKARKATRKDSYIYREAFKYVLQRLAGDLLIPVDDHGPHLVMIDGRDDFAEMQGVFERGYRKGWPNLPHHPMPPLRKRGFSASLAACSNGPLHEIADLVVSCTARWADERCMEHKGGKASDVAELNNCMTDLIDLFPVAPNWIPPRRCGYSIIVHAGNRTGKELLRDNVDDWASELESAAAKRRSSDIPF